MKSCSDVDNFTVLYQHMVHVYYYSESGVIGYCISVGCML